MLRGIRLGVVGSLWIASAVSTCAQDTVLFSGKDLEGWSFHAREGEPAKDVDDVWVVRSNSLVCTGASTGYLMCAGPFEDYVLTLEWRWMRSNKNGVAVSGSGSVFIHATDEEGAFHAPKSIEVSLDDLGSVYFRDVSPRADAKLWAFRAPDFADDVERDVGEWNHLKLISNGDRLTVIVNGIAVNQVDGLTRTKGAIALKSQRSFIPAPAFYRNVRLQPLTQAHSQDEQNATRQLTKFRARLAQQEAAADRARRETERLSELKKEHLAREWGDVQVAQDAPPQTDARYLPFPSDAQELQFDATFGDIRLTSPSSLRALTAFYRTEMPKRGWSVVEKELEEDSVEVTFACGAARVELSLDQRSDGVDVRMDCEGLLFDGTNDPASLVALGVPQPRGYVFLQKEVELPQNVQQLEFDGGDRCLFKSNLELQEAFDFLTEQLRGKGYRETRRPIVKSNRRYTELAKANREISVNVFSDEVGSRIVLQYEENP